MKKAISLLLALLLCLSLTACGKSEAVKNVEAMIDALGEITLESIDAIRSAEDAYNALTENERKKVDNYATLTEARDAYYELVLVGNWYSSEIELYDVEANYEDLGFTLNSNLSCTNYEYGNTSSGVWSVTDCILRTNFEEGWENSYIIKDVDGKISLQLEYSESGCTMMKEDDYFAYLDSIFLIVDLSEVDINDYCELYLMDHESLNEWGEPNGWGATYVMVGSKAYRNGWYYLTYNDIAIEVLFPQYTVTRTFPDGTNYEYVEEATTHTMAYDKLFWYYVYAINTKSPDYTDISDVTLDQLSLGRAKGKVYFISKEYVKEVITDTGWQWTRRFVLIDGSTFEAPYDSELWCEDHPY